ncbi:MAG: hypothetical protein KGN16_04010 [Burkholderiales bacterium]|nr:hypothetical protein [Burkholderiales bacterium]
MQAPCPGGCRRHGLAGAAATTLLSGCAATGDGVAGIGALLLVAAIAYALGALRERWARRRELHTERSRVRELEQLAAAWLWQTDAAQRLRSWRAPDGRFAASCPLFEAGDAALVERLRARSPFDGLRIELAEPLAGARVWELAGVPRYDDAGQYAGCSGRARPLDTAEAAQGRADAVVPLLQAQGAPALLALDRGHGWQVQGHNAPAQALCPELDAGMPLDAVLALLPQGLREAVARLAAPGAEAASASATTEADGWRVVRFDSGAARGLLLLPARGAAAAGTSAADENESFGFTVSHDLRAPIRVVEGFTRILKEDYGKQLDRVGNDHLDRVLSAAARMNGMIDALMTLARLSAQPLQRQPVNLSQLAHYVVDDLRRATPEREATFDIEGGLTARGDPTLLRLVLENLLGNAWKYSARCAHTEISLRAQPHGAGVAYVVRDNGAGFDMRAADRLFGLFQRLHSASEFPGHGVGLASVRRIVHRHGGSIWAESEPGRGAAFFFTLAS